MAKKLFVVLLIIVGVAAGLVVLRGDEDTWTCSNGTWIKHGNPSRPQPEKPCPGVKVSPSLSYAAQTVYSFYSWYLQQSDGLTVYKDSPYLSEGYKTKVASITAGFKDGGYDPLLLAQDKPVRFEVKNTVVEGDTARVQVEEYFGTGSQSVMAALQRVNGKWFITDILPWEEQSKNRENATKTVIVYYANPKKSSNATDCGLVYGVERKAGINDGYDTLLRQLFMGPTMQERNEGYTSMFSKNTDGILNSVKVESRIAYVDLKDIRTIIPNASASCASQEFFAEIGETLKHDRRIDKVFFAINGEPEAFYEWMQIGCSKDNNFCDATPFK